MLPVLPHLDTTVIDQGPISRLFPQQEKKMPPINTQLFTAARIQKEKREGKKGRKGARKKLGMSNRMCKNCCAFINPSSRNLFFWGGWGGG